jgi:hypothetical protein
MAASYDFVALPEDFALLETWLYDHGAVRYGVQPADGAIVMHFPEFGPISFWPEKPNLDRYKGSEWKAAALSAIERAEDPLTPRVNELESPVAGLRQPVSDPRGFWRSSSLWFPTPALHKRFPGLAAINNQLERWFRAHPTIFDNRRREPIDEFPRTLGGFDGFITRVYALPAAYRLLTSGGSFVHRLASAKTVDEFLKSKSLRSEPIS